MSGLEQRRKTSMDVEAGVGTDQNPGNVMNLELSAQPTDRSDISTKSVEIACLTSSEW